MNLTCDEQVRRSALGESSKPSAASAAALTPLLKDFINNVIVPILVRDYLEMRTSRLCGADPVILDHTGAGADDRCAAQTKAKNEGGKGSQKKLDEEIAEQ